MTKQQLYTRLTASTVTEKIIIERADNLRDLKIELCESMNKYNCILSQVLRGSEFQFYSGYRYSYNMESDTCNKVITACKNIALKMNYKLYSPNGFWYIKTL